jgi:hypothetical protein
MKIQKPQCFKQIDQFAEDQWDLIRTLLEKFTPNQSMQRLVWLILIEASARHVMNNARKMLIVQSPTLNENPSPS